MAGHIELREELVEGHPAVRFQTALWSGVVVPGIGAKVISLVARASGNEWLWRQPERSLRLPAYGAAFSDYDISGFDECFPGIAEGPYPEAPWQGITVPDHGELWSRPWSYELLPNELRMWIDGVRFPYTFERSLSATNRGALSWTYRVTNRHSSPRTYVWAAHPLFRAEPGMAIRLPAGTDIVVDSSKDERLGGSLARHAWPITHDISGNSVDLSVIEGAQHGGADKLYAVGLREGWAALYDSGSGNYLALTFDTDQIPHLGIWINQGGWPSDAPPSFNVALEPCSGYPDQLDVAVEHGGASTLDAHATATWSFQMHGGRASTFSGVDADGTVF